MLYGSADQPDDEVLVMLKDPLSTTIEKNPILSSSGPRATATFDEEQGLFVVEHRTTVWRGDRFLAAAVTIDRLSSQTAPCTLPRLLRPVEIYDDAFARDLDALWEIRARRGRGPALRAAGWRPEPIGLEIAGEPRTAYELLPPFLPFERPRHATEFHLRKATE